MKKMTLLTGILAMVLVFGMTVVGCDPNVYYDINDYGFVTTNPTETIFENKIISLDDFNEIKNFNLSKYLGWKVYDSSPDRIYIVWSGLSQTEKNDIINFVSNKFAYSQIMGINGMDIRSADLILGL